MSVPKCTNTCLWNTVIPIYIICGSDQQPMNESITNTVGLLIKYTGFIQMHSIMYKKRMDSFLYFGEKSSKKNQHYVAYMISFLVSQRRKSVKPAVLRMGSCIQDSKSGGHSIFALPSTTFFCLTVKPSQMTAARTMRGNSSSSNEWYGR